MDATRQHYFLKTFLCVQVEKIQISMYSSAHHCDTEAPYVRLDTVAFLVEVRVDPLRLKKKTLRTDKWYKYLIITFLFFFLINKFKK